MIPRDVIDDILRRVSIVEVMSPYVALKKSGSHDFKGLCPFHNDRNTPSLHVNEQKGLYHCFSCGAGGNVLTFLKEHQKLDFIDSIKLLGQMVGIDVESYLNQKTDDLPLRNKIKTMHQIAQDYFQQNLFTVNNPQVKLAVDTIKSRKLDKNTLAMFGLGFGGLGGLFQKLQGEGFKAEEIIASGLCGKSENGQIYDRFRNRITFPICDSEGVIIAFGGRIIDQSSPAKYINSPETPLFKKGSVLYGWDLAKEKVLESGEIILVEGYMDVIRMFQAGFSNTVAPLGTGLTEDRIHFLKHKVDNIILCFDGDSAGQKSAYRSSGIAAKLEVPTKVAVLPENEDPDTFIVENGSNKMLEILQNSQESVNFVINSAQKHLPDSNKFLQEVFEYAVSLEGVVLNAPLSIKTSQFLKKVSEILNVSYNSVELEFSRFKQYYIRLQNNEFTFNSTTKNNKKDNEEEFELIAILSVFPEFIDTVASVVEVEDFYHQDTKNIFNQMLLHPEKTSQDWIIAIADTDIVSYTGKWMDSPDVRIIQNFAVSLRIKSLKKKLSLIKETGLTPQIINIQQELISLKQKFYNL